jgi:hypothetical protein
MTCEETTESIRNHDALVAERGAAISAGNVTGGDGASWMDVKTSDHSHGADKKMDAYFADPQTLSLANKFVMPDVRKFNYPILQSRRVAGARR